MITTLHHDMAERSAVASFIFDINSSAFKYVNQAMLTLLNATAQDISINGIGQIIHEEDYAYVVKAVEQLKSTTHSSQVQFRIITDQDVKWVRVMASLVERGDGQHLVYGNAIDVTSEVVSQQLYEKYANKKNAVLNILAHDLTGPLGVINILGSSLKSSGRDAADVKLIESILKINQQAIDLIQQLTSSEFLETAAIVLNKKRINVSQKVKEYIEEYQKSSEETKRSFYFTSTPENIILDVDEPKLFQIFNNLTTNALKFTKENGQISVSIEEHPETVVFHVKDDGIGIPEEYHDILFDKFTDARRQGLQGEPSMGLGMYVIKNIIEWHNGQVWVDSGADKGTTISFSIPKA